LCRNQKVIQAMAEVAGGVVEEVAGGVVEEVGVGGVELGRSITWHMRNLMNNLARQLI
jgi:hypothetical protein